MADRKVHQNIQEYQLNMDAEIAARQQLAEAGVYKPEDLTDGRADVGRVAEVFTRANVDEEIQPLLAEKALRDAEFERHAEGVEQPLPRDLDEATRQNPQDRLAQMQGELEAAKAEAERYRTLYGREANEKGNFRRRLREIEDRLEGRQGGYQPPAQPYGYTPQPVMPPVADPNQPVTLQDVYSLMMAQSAAFGSQLRQSREEAIREAKSLNGYNLTVDEEEDLLDGNPWLKSLPAGQREQAMMALARPANGRPQPAGGRRPLPPSAPNQEEILRAKLRQAAFIEAPSGASTQERAAQSPTDIATAKKLQDLKVAAATPGGSKKMEEILASMGAGVTDDRDRGFPRR